MSGLDHQDAAASFEPLRPRLTRVAYRMLGSVADAMPADTASPPARGNGCACDGFA
jgi:hypothetical protein